MLPSPMTSRTSPVLRSSVSPGLRPTRAPLSPTGTETRPSSRRVAPMRGASGEVSSKPSPLTQTVDGPSERLT